MHTGSKPVAYNRADLVCEPHLDYGGVLFPDAVEKNIKELIIKKLNIITH